MGDSYYSYPHLQKRVPADKHPQIAPEEFAKYIETQGSIVPTKRASSLQRRHTLLSESFTTDHDCSGTIFIKKNHND